MTGRRSAFVAVALVVACAPSSARAQGKNDAAAAEALFKEGKRLMSGGQYAAACPKFVESQRIDPGIGTMLWLADCHSKNGQIASAWAVFHEAEALAAKSKDPRVVVAREEAQKLEPRISKLVLDVSDVVDISDLDIKRDGVSLGRPLWNTPIPTDGGTHIITASALSKRPFQTTISVPMEQGSVTVKIPRLVEEDTAAALPAPKETPAPAKPDPQRGRIQRIAGLGVGAVGLVSVALGAYFGLAVKSKNDESKEHCLENHCNATGYALRNDALDFATVADVAFIVGAAALAGGAVLYFTAPRPGPVSVDRSSARRLVLGGAPTPTGGAAFLSARF